MEMRLLTKVRVLSAAFICLNSVTANAMDIPMDRGLAYKQLESKTCFSEFSRNGQLAGIELQDLLISQGGKLATLKPIGSFEVGDNTTRKYRGAGLEVSITPSSSQKTGNDLAYEIREKAKLTITRKGKPVKFNVEVVFKCPQL